MPVKSSLSSKSKLSDLPAEPLAGELSSLDAALPPHLATSDTKKIKIKNKREREKLSAF